MKMTKHLVRLLAVAALPMISAFADTMIYNTNSSPLPGDVYSLNYQGTGTAEFGDLIQFGAGPRNLTSAILTMSDWAMESTYEPVGTSAGYTKSLTLNLYNVGAGNTVGSLIGSDTIAAFVPWRPEASNSAACDTLSEWQDGSGNCWNGLAFQVTFALG